RGLLLALCLCITGGTVFATNDPVTKVENPSVHQNASVQGRVTDDNGTPISGVTVSIQGTSMQTSTDQNGNYRLNNVAENAILIFSYVGYEQQSVEVGNRAVI